MQKLWQLKIDWDESVPQELHQTWLNFCEQLNVLNSMTFQRKVVEGTEDIQLHGFCDASEVGYGACFYVRSKNNSDFKSHIVCAKSRVAPLKTITIPRLELCGALLLSELFLQIKDAIDIPFTKIRLWSDSSIALSWIKSSPNLLKTFVANRVTKIQSKTELEFWDHVRSADNPADALSRGQLPIEFLNNTLWYHGPSWLSQPESQWPISMFS